MNIRRSLYGAVIVAILLAPSAHAQAYVDGASTFVARLGERAVAMLADTSISADERRQRFRALFNESFAVAGIGRFVLGRHWRSATPQQRQEYLELFETLIISTWSSRFEQYSSVKFEVTGVRPIRSSRPDENVALVGSKIEGDATSNFEVDWRVANKDQLYLITDVLVAGVSLATTHRAEFGSVIRREGGIDGLLSFMRAKRDGVLSPDVPR